MSNLAYFHSLLSATAAHLYILGYCSYDTVVHHKAKTVAAINANLSSPSLGLDDGNIGAVFSLLCVEEIMRPPIVASNSLDYAEGARQRVIHLNGLVRMMQLRGGLKNLHSNPVIQAFVLWYVHRWDTNDETDPEQAQYTACTCIVFRSLHYHRGS